MEGRRLLILAVALPVVLALGKGSVSADEQVTASPVERSALDVTHCWGGCKAGEHNDRRAGCPQGVAWYAHPGESCAFIGYYVGGGSACGGTSPCPDEGTWGWDYRGFVFPRRVALNWTHGRRYQGGTGDYRTDGGPHVPDVPSLLNPALYHKCP